MQILDPRNPNADRKLRLPTVPSLHGKRLAFLNNGWASMTRIGKLIEDDLKKTYGVSDIAYFDVPRNMEPPDGLLDRIAREHDAAIVGMAN